MKDWKINQMLYHASVTEHTDDPSNFETIVDEKNKVERAIWYFDKPDPNIAYYPSKSYVVALVYAALLNKYFNEDFYEVLSDPDLLYGNDPYFVPYTKDKETYDRILETLGGCDNIPLSGPLVDHTVRYFFKECLGDTNANG